jgi:hypothetical protein
VISHISQFDTDYVHSLTSNVFCGSFLLRLHCLCHSLTLRLACVSSGVVLSWQLPYVVRAAVWCSYAQVIPNGPPPSPLLAIQAITHFLVAMPRALDANLEAECVQWAISMLKLKPKPEQPASGHALVALSIILGRAPTSVGQTFIDGGGVPLLLSHLESSSSHDAALLTVLQIADNKVNMAGVRRLLAEHANCPDLESLCEAHPPSDHASQRTLQQCFRSAFDRRPKWTEGDKLDKVCDLFHGRHSNVFLRALGLYPRRAHNLSSH